VCNAGLYDFVAGDIIVNVVAVRILSFDCGLVGLYTGRWIWIVTFCTIGAIRWKGGI
jgi:hypothetical protein